MAHHYGTPMRKDESLMRWVFKPKALSIVWGDEQSFWKFSGDEYVELQGVRWLEVRGSTMENLKKGKSYEIKFEIEIIKNAYSDWDVPVLMMAKIGSEGRYKCRRFNFYGLRGKGKTQIPNDSTTQIPNAGDSSTEIPIADDKFIIKVPQNSGNDTVLHFGLYEVWSGSWKSGLKIYEAQVTEIP